VSGCAFSAHVGGQATFCGSICPISDRNLKQDIEPIDNQTILQRVAELPISAWSYTTEPARRHIGSMAQDSCRPSRLARTVHLGGGQLAVAEPQRDLSDIVRSLEHDHGAGMSEHMRRQRRSHTESSTSAFRWYTSRCSAIN
jgi:hypothetical protein